jgi:hypothetical protein
MKTQLLNGERVLIAPELTGTKDWLLGNVIEIDNTNPFGAVISASANDDVFFGREYSFRRAAECLQ